MPSSEAAPAHDDAERGVLMQRILASHDRAIRRIAGVYAGATGEADDLRQEILLRIWKALPSFRGQSALGTWAFRVALNTALTWRRRDRAAVNGAAEPPEPSTVGQPRDAQAIFAEFLGTLGTADRTVLVLFAEGLSAAQVADVLGLTANAVALRLTRIKQRYSRDYLEP